MHAAPLAGGQCQIAGLFHLADGRVDGLLRNTGGVTDIFLQAAVSQFADRVENVEGTVGQTEAQCDIVVDLVCLFINPVKFF